MTKKKMRKKKSDLSRPPQIIIDPGRRHRTHDPESTAPTPKPTYLPIELKTGVKSMTLKAFRRPGEFWTRFRRPLGALERAIPPHRISEICERNRTFRHMYSCLYIELPTRRRRYRHSTLVVVPRPQGSSRRKCGHRRPINLAGNANTSSTGRSEF